MIAQPLWPLFSWVVLFALVSLGPTSLQAAELTAGTPAWKQLEQQPASWPAQVMLKVPVKLTILQNGQPAGAILAPAESMVQVVAVSDAGLVVGVAAAQATIPPEQRDLAQRLTVAAPPATPVAAATNTAPAPSPSPAPSQTAASSTAPPSPAPSPASAPAAAESGPPVLGGPAFHFDLTAPESRGYRAAAFRFWSPNYSQPLRGLIVLTPGNDGDGRGMADDPAWQALARKYGLGLVASSLQGGAYQRPEMGSGDAFHAALRNFATQSGHAEITTVPLLLWGISAGGQWNYNYMVWRPEEVMAFVVNKGGYYTDEEPGERAHETPGLFILGQADQAFRIQAITGLWTAGRKQGALWALAPQPGSGHEFSKTDPLARVFFEAVLKARLPDSGNGLAVDGADGGNAPTMKPMDESAGWLGNLTTHEIHAAGLPAEGDRESAWLPDEATARAWKVFVSGG